jgi:anti-sigma-K factor RskA
MSDDSTKAAANDHASTALEELIALYALGALDDDDRATVERRLETDAQARALLGEALETVNRLYTGVETVAPPQQLKRRLFALVDADLSARPAARAPQVAPPAQMEDVWSRLTRMLRAVSPMLAAAALVLACALGAWALSLQNQLAQAQQMLALLQTPGLRAASIPKADTGPATAQATLFMAPGSTTGWLAVNGLTPLDASQTYQFWLIRGGQPVPAGTFNVDASGSGRLLVHSGEPIGNFEQAGITIEPAGGSQTPNLATLVSIGSIQ